MKFKVGDRVLVLSCERSTAPNTSIGEVGVIFRSIKEGEMFSYYINPKILPIHYVRFDKNSPGTTINEWYYCEEEIVNVKDLSLFEQAIYGI